MREIGEIELSIQGGTEEIEALGEAGKVEESMAKLAAVDALKQEKANKEKELQDLNENAGASGHQKLRVCEICVGPRLFCGCPPLPAAQADRFRAPCCQSSTRTSDWRTTSAER